MTELLNLTGVFDVSLNTCAYGIQLDGQEGGKFFVHQDLSFGTNTLPLRLSVDIVQEFRKLM